MIRVQDIGPIAYGGLVTWLTDVDKDRVAKNEIRENEWYKKASFYAYVVPGAVSLIANAMGLMRRWEPWTERIMHGFLYDLPRFAKGMVASLKTSASVGAISEAQRILAEARARQIPSPVYRPAQSARASVGIEI